MHPKDERMGAFDAVMYDIEGDPLLRSAIVSFIVLDKAPDRQRLVERTERLTRKFPRLRQRAVGNPFSPAPPRWETDPNFDPAYHVRWRRLDESEADLGGALVYAARLGDGEQVAIVTPQAAKIGVGGGKSQFMDTHFKA